jgi:HK97 family phage prohead protease
MSKAYSKLTIKSVSDAEERVIVGVASTPTPDRSNDIVEPMGVEFALPIPLLWQHNHMQPIGEVTSATVTENGIEITAKIVQIDELGALKDRIDEAWQSIKSGLVKCLSIGFRPIEYNYLENYGIHFLKWEWFELSAVTIPDNRESQITSVKDFRQVFASESLPASGQKSTEKPETSQTDNSSDVAEVDQPQAASTPASASYVTLIDPNQGGVSYAS